MTKQIFTGFIGVFLSIIIGLNTAMGNEATSSAQEQAQILQRTTIIGTPYQMGMEVAKLMPYSTKPPHMHTGPELIYVLEGEVTFIIKGQPAKTIKQAKAFKHHRMLCMKLKPGQKALKSLLCGL